MGKENQIAEIAKIEKLEAENANLTVENEVLQSEKENLMRTLEEGCEEIESARKETAQEIFIKLMQEIDELEQYYIRLNMLHTEINLTTIKAAKKIIRRILGKYGVADKAERDIINLRLGIEKKDFEIITTALREYAKNHPNPKCHANEANDLAHLIEYQRRKIEE